MKTTNMQKLAERIHEKKDHLTQNDRDLRALFQAIYPKLRNYIKKYNACDEDTEEILHEVVYKIYKNINSYNNEYRFTTWIYNIAKNVSMGYSNRHKLNYLDFDDSSTKSYIPKQDLQVGNEFEEVMEREKELKDLHSIVINEAFNMKEDTEKHAFIESFINNKTNKAIANENDIKINTVKTRIRRAKKIIKNNIINKYPERAQRVKELFI
jgi:RNA polymerase sigma-70 factor (ECF subfamily)